MTSVSKETRSRKKGVEIVQGRKEVLLRKLMKRIRARRRSGGGGWMEIGGIRRQLV